MSGWMPCTTELFPHFNIEAYVTILNMLRRPLNILLIFLIFILTSLKPNLCSPLLRSLPMGNSLHLRSSDALPISTSFQFPSPLPHWPTGEGFGGGTIDLGGLRVRQVTSFARVWATLEGGPGGTGATFFEPSPVPEGFSVLGHYAQPNNRPLFGWVLVAKDPAAPSDASPALKPPSDYTLLSTIQDSGGGAHGYIWLPTPPDGYKPVGLIVTASPEKPSLDRVKCVRSDITESCETDDFIWGHGKNASDGGFEVFGLRPENRGSRAQGVSTGTFVGLNNGSSTNSLPLSCLKNLNLGRSNASQIPTPMPNLAQIEELFKAYSPFIFFHPKEQFLPSSVTWFFANGALLYSKANESSPVAVEPTGTNLPQGGSNDGAYWLDLPAGNTATKDKLMEGNLESSEAYLHVKPMLGATFTDVAVWIFYPFNGAARAKVGLIDSVPLGRIGEHVGDWEHVTLRVSNFNGELRSVFFSEHSGGRWVPAPELRFKSGSNKPVAYSSLHGHATYSKPGLVLQGTGDIGIRNDAAESRTAMDAGARFSVVAAEYLGTAAPPSPPWLNYAREWGPKITYEDIAEEIGKVEKVLPGKLKSAFEKFVKSLPAELLGEEGPTGPKMKSNWDGDEVD